VTDHDTREAIREAALAAAEKLRALAETREQAIAAFETGVSAKELAAAMGLGRKITPARVDAQAALRALIAAADGASIKPPEIQPIALMHALDLSLDGADDNIRWARGLESYAKSLRPRGRPRKDPDRLASDENVRSFCVTPTQREWLRAQPGGIAGTLRALIDAMGPGLYPAAKYYETDEAADITTGARLGDYETTLHEHARQAGVGLWELLRAAIERARLEKPKRAKKG
jgi:hypothetical protein